MDKEDRGRRARALLDDPLLEQVLSGLDAQYVKAWRGAKTLEAREGAHRYICLIERLKEDLSSQALTGALSARRRAELEGRERFWR